MLGWLYYNGMYLGHEGFEVFVSEEDLRLELLEALIVAPG